MLAEANPEGESAVLSVAQSDPFVIGGNLSVQLTRTNALGSLEMIQQS